MKNTSSGWSTLFLVVAASGSSAADIGTAFTYQGYVEHTPGAALTDTCQFEFRLCDDPVAACSPGLISSHSGIDVSAGNFTVSGIDFGVDAINGTARWLEIRVICQNAGACCQDATTIGCVTNSECTAGGAAGPCAPCLLSPRLELKPVPHALALPGLYTRQHAFGPNIIGGSPSNVVTTGVIGATISGGGITDVGPNEVTDHFGTVSGGFGNLAGDRDGNMESSHVATVGGGASNSARSAFATIGGGTGNTTSSPFSTIGGGQSNMAEGGQCQCLSSGEPCSIDSDCAGGPDDLCGCGPFVTIGGGYGNTANGRSCTVSGGYQNTASSDYSTVAGGSDNTGNGQYSSIGGGGQNTASGSHSTIGGGVQNTASGPWSTVGGGAGNTPSGATSTVCGGEANTASGHSSSVGGGFANVASGSYSAVAGGLTNLASGLKCTVSGGTGNLASGDYATVSGGIGNTALGARSHVGAGDSNVAGGMFSAVPGGLSNMAGGDSSFAAGQGARIRDAASTGDGDGDQGTFVWADASIPTFFTSTGPNQFLIRAAGGVGIGTNSPGMSLEVATPSYYGKATAGVVDGASAWAYLLADETHHSLIWDSDTDMRFGTETARGAGYVERMRFTGTGRLGIGDDTPDAALDVVGDIHYSGVITDVSDERLKENIAPVEDALEKIAQLRGVYFSMKGRAGEREIGVVAQNVQEVLPEAVRIVDTEEGYLGVSYPSLVALLAEGVKDMHAMVQERDCEINELNSEIANLKSAISELKGVQSRLTELEALLKKQAEQNGEAQ